MPFDIQPVIHAGPDALDELLFKTVYLPQAVSPETLAENHRTLLEQLVALRMAGNIYPNYPTNCGILVLGKEPTDYIPGAYIQFEGNAHEHSSY